MRRQVWMYVLYAYSISWSIVLGLYFLYRQNKISISELNIYYALGACGPFLSAIICSHMFYRKTGLKSPFAKLRLTNIGRVSVLLSISPLLLFAAGYLLYPVFGHQWFSFQLTREQFHLNDAISYFGWALPLITYSVFEEFGWRGFMLPHLQLKYTAFKSSAILAFVWAAWHLPFFLFRFPFSIGNVIGLFVGIFVGTIILTSIFNLSKGSVLACIIFHLANNIASAFDKNYIVAVVSMGLVVIALFLVVKFKPKNLANRERIMC